MRLSPILAAHENLLAQVISELMETIHKNDYGFPLGIYRPDLLPLDDYRPNQHAADRLYEEASRLSKKKEPREIRAKLYDDDFDPLALMGDDNAEYGEFTEDDGAEAPRDPQSVGEFQPEEEGAAHTETSSVPTPIESSSDIGSVRVAGFRHEDLKAAFIPLNFDEGFPTLPDGRPFWEKLEYEPSQYHEAFQAYIQMPQVSNGVRSLNDLAEVMVTNGLLDLEGYNYSMFTLKFKVVSQIYLWHLRARAFDLYRIAAHKKQQEFRAVNVQDQHFNMSSKLLNRLSQYMESEEDFWDLMTPKVAMDMFKALVATQRISVGLPASGPAPTKDGEGVNTFEMILRTLAQQGGVQEVARVGSDNRLAAKILESPEATQLAQELIIKMTQQAQGQDGMPE